ncbi:hypothetical protein E2C01_040585 [Portunus trituberculatus]|uniref:Uncharacterized protein n=1 Tax=Portunus trituberculatus TaxID=210409 RepID=A0A5B7FN17_PORTR|nr:hypothetical protein [Portunus trituberculatus]
MQEEDERTTAKITAKQKSTVENITSHQLTLSTTAISAPYVPLLLSAAHKPPRISCSSDSMVQIFLSLR